MNIESRGAEHERAIHREFYHADGYFEYDQLWSFVEQLHHIHALRPKRLLEIGVGNGFVSQFLRSSGIDVLTCDINPDLKPDCVLCVTEISQHIEPHVYDLIACCEVLEHLPFEHFEQAIQDFASLSDRLFLSLPLFGLKFGIGGVWNIRYRRSWFHKSVSIRSSLYKMAPMHFWELGSEKQTEVTRVQSLLRKYFKSVNSDTFKLNPYHRYFVCSNAT